MFSPELIRKIRPLIAFCLSDIDLWHCNKLLATAEFCDSINDIELTLGPDTQRMLEEKLKEGRSTDEVMQAGILAVNGHFPGELDAETHAEIDRAEEAIERGEIHRWEDVKEEVLAMFKRK